MITAKNSSVAGKGTATEYYGLSTDTKPLELPNGSAFIEMDTGAVYLFDAENSEWIALGDSQVSGVVPSDSGEASTK